jgi:glycogen debranching enzyme
MSADPELRKFEAVFGRDALRVDQFIGGLFPRLRRVTVDTLARGQGVQHDIASEEEPGKIVHEWRDAYDPIAREITAQSGWGWPYFGSVDATPLFVIAAIRLLRAEPDAGDRVAKRRDGSRPTLNACVGDAVDWLCRRVDYDPDGLLTYQRINPCGIENQTWRDSWDSLSHADGTLANFERPVAALDVQAAAYDALLTVARYRSDATANALRERADRIRTAVLNRFWTEHPSGGFFAAALDYTSTGTRRPLETRTSDMGHLLTSELLDGEGLQEYRNAVIRELFSPGMLCSYGVRSLHADEIRFWPGGYHTGNSWLWQTMHIADGLERHGFPALADELRLRCRHVHMTTGLLPEFARGTDDRGILNDRVVDVHQALDQRDNRLEQPPQEVQAWTVASLHAWEHRERQADKQTGPPHLLEQRILGQLRVSPRTLR